MLEVDTLSLLKRGITLAKTGNQKQARRLFVQVTRQEPNNIHGWLWLAAVAGSLDRTAYCLKRALVIDPTNDRAQRALNRIHERIDTHKRKTAVVEKAPTLGSILIVDDSPTVRKLVTLTLSRRGYEVVEAADGMEALAKIAEALPDLVLLDITMPRMDGYQVCKILKDNHNTRHIPVLMLSGKDGFFDKVRGRMVGAAAYLTKPFEPMKLIAAVQERVRPPMQKLNGSVAR